MIDTTTPLDVWLKFDHVLDDCDACDVIDDGPARHEANTYFNEDGTYRVEWYLNAVGLVSTETFPTYEKAVEWYAREGFQDFSS